MPTHSLKELLSERHHIIKDISKDSYVQDEQGRQVIDGRYAMITGITRQMADRWGEQFGLTTLEVPDASQARTYRGKVVFVKGADRSEPIILGAGNYGYAMLSERLEDQAGIAVKILKTKEAQDASYLEMVLQYRLKGKPHVLGLYDTYLGKDQETQEPVLYQFMLLAGMGNVEKLRQELTTLTDLKLKDLIITRIIKGVLLGTWHMHQAGVVHGDQKPANWLVNEKGEACVADFGCSVFTEPDFKIQPRQETIRDDIGHSIKLIIGAGDVGYCSPEKNTGWEKRQLFDGRAADLWAIGVGLAELLSGQAIAERYLPPEKVERILDCCQDLSELADLARQLMAKPCPSWEVLLNHRALQRSAAHEEQLQATAISYLKIYVKQHALQALKEANARLNYLGGEEDSQEERVPELIATDESLQGQAKEGKKEIQSTFVESTDDDDGRYITRYYGRDIALGDKHIPASRLLARSGNQSKLPLRQSSHAKLALSLSQSGHRLEETPPVVTLSLLAPLMRPLVFDLNDEDSSNEKLATRSVKNHSSAINPRWL